MAVSPFNLGLAAPEDIGPGESLGEAAQGIDGGDHFWIDLAGENLVGDPGRAFVGDALALEEGGFEAGLFHGPGDGLAAAVDDDGVDLYRLEEDHVTGDAVANRRVWRVHETAAVFNDEGGAAELLDVGQRFQQGGCFDNEVLHRVGIPFNGAGADSRRRAGQWLRLQGWSR